MRITLLCGALLGLAAACGAKHPPVHLPTRTTGVPHISAGHPALTITVGADGQVFVGDRAVNLDELSTSAAQAPGLPRGVRSPARSRTVARLRIDRAAPWQHVQWVLTVLAEQAIAHARFVYADPVVGAVDLPWEMPVDS